MVNVISHEKVQKIFILLMCCKFFTYFITPINTIVLKTRQINGFEDQFSMKIVFKSMFTDSNC